MNTTTKPTIGFWIVSIVALIWNAMGVYHYLIQAYNTESFRAAHTEEQLAHMANSPAWVTAAFAIAVFTGLLGCIALLLRKKWATSLFFISIIAVIVQQIYVFFIGKSYQYFETAQNTMLIIVLLIALFLLWFSKHATRKGWLL